jgi:hypothetical protein
MIFDVSGIGSPRTSDIQRQAEAALGLRPSGSPSFAEAAAHAALDSLPKSPPPEVASALAVASDAYDQLSAAGHQIHFGFNQLGGRFAVELQDLHGNPLSTLSGSDALQIAGGESPN